ncbi:MAG: flagellar hook-length control protein FliK [Desulfobulbaceae bacterium]|nr:flagellar hook-length control protein FliK [Desulfobulbaceae bacterium]
MKISDLNNIPLSKTTASVSTPSTDSSQSDGKQSFSPGELLKAVVNGFTEDGKVLLDIGGRLITAKSMTPLTLNSELWLEVAKGGDQPLLSLAGKKGAVQNFLKSFLAHSQQLSPQTSKPALPSLLSTLLPPSAQGLPLTDQVAAGSIIAAHVDQKPAPEMLKLVAMLLGGKTDIKNELFSTDIKTGTEKLLQGTDLHHAEKLIKILSAHHEVNSQPPAPSNENFFLFPCFFASQSGWGEWIFSMEQDGGEEGNYTLAFFLEMSNLGPLTLRASISDRSFSGEFRLRTEKARAFLATQLPELEAILRKQHYSPVSLTCKISSENLVQQLKKTLEEKAAIKRFSLIDVSV